MPEGPAPRPQHTLGVSSDRLAAIGLMCLAVAFFSALDTAAKVLTTRMGIPVIEAVWARFICQFAGLLILVPALGIMPMADMFKTTRLKFQLVRSVLMVATTAFNFLALQTLRLDLREFVAGDFDDLYRLDRDPRVVRYVGNGQPVPRAAIAPMLRRVRRNYALYPDLGTWHASRRDTGAFIGWFSLKYCGKSPDIEIGYRLLHSAWGRGFATEGATALLRFGFDELGLTRIIGVTHPDNVASQRVLMKAGLEDCGWGHYYDKRLRLFAATSGDT